jgi:hypothetical protein
MQVRAAHAAGVHVEQQLAVAGSRLGQLERLERPPDLDQRHRPHRRTFARLLAVVHIAPM